MNQRIRELAHEAGLPTYNPDGMPTKLEKFAELLHRQVIASILITDVVMEEKGLKPTSEDYIRGINKDLGVE
jgi:hypothetical protein